MLKLLAESASGNQFSVQDIRNLQKKLKDLQPKLRTEFMREIKQIGKEPERAVRNSIPTDAPLRRGLTKPGASLKWGEVTKGAKSGGAKSTTIRFRTQAGGKSLTATLLAIRVNSAASSVADMAGRSRRYIGKGYRGSGYSKLIRRTYQDGSQSVEFRREATRKGGEAFIRNLNAALGSDPSRRVWKAVEKDLPQISRSVQYVVDKWAIKTSKDF